MKNKKLIQINLMKIILVVMAIVMIGNIGYSTSGSLNVVLSSQNPDPVQPGNFVYLNVKLSNSGLGSSNNIIVNMENNKYFTIAPGYNSTQNVGIIPPYSAGTNTNNFVIAKFKVQVADNTPAGLNTVNFNVNDGSQTYTYNFNVLVENKNPNILISSLNVSPIQAGQKQNLSLVIENPNSGVLKNVLVSLALDKVTPSPDLSMVSDSNQQLIPVLNPGQKIKLNFEIASSPTSLSQPYNLPIDVSYQDTLGNQFSKEILGSVKVFSNPLFTLKLSSQDIFSRGTGNVNFAIANPGISTIKGVQVQILKSDNYDVISGGFEYIGNLNPDDFQTMQSKLYFNSDKDFNISLLVTYLDSYNNMQQKIITVPVKIYSQSQLQTFGMSTASGSSTSYTGILIGIILIVIAFYFGRRAGIKKAKK